MIYRKADPTEMDWVYRLFKSCLQEYISATWGWDELFQRHSFDENITAADFVIARWKNEDIGGYSLQKKDGYLYLEMLLVEPCWQRQGLGRVIMQHLIEQSAQQRLPLRLSVLKTNPAADFYTRLGLHTESEDQYRYRMIWLPA
jgi:ribosomal protein S18 acetylase RimI-like enzyme